ncbi:hypothetical protein HZB02_04320 [Candidatus Woesearchaeota archaeon]|nr:hypothetical protein [Candidatus Woesearchaeota archaeon]
MKKEYVFGLVIVIITRVGGMLVRGYVQEKELNPFSIKSFDINTWVKEHYKNCAEPKFCSNLVMVDCGAEVDGPAYYLNKKNGELISACGGVCWGPQGCNTTLCPPKEWDCK